MRNRPVLQQAQQMSVIKAGQTNDTAAVSMMNGKTDTICDAWKQRSTNNKSRY